MKQQPLKIGCIFEGPTDRHVIPVLVSQLLKQPIELIPLRKTSSGWHDFKRPSPQDLRAGRRRPRWGMFQSYVKSLVIAGAEVIVVVADHDADEDIGHAEPFPHKRWCMLGQHVPFDTQPHLCLIDAARRAVMCQDHRLGPPCFPDCVTDVYKPDQLLVIIGIAKQMLEAWLLAQPDVVETVLWARLSAQDRARCQTPEAIPHPKNAIIHRYNGGSDLSRQQAEAIGTHPDFSASVIASRCPSFARFAHDVRSLLTSCVIRH